MERSDALLKLKDLEGADLHTLAKQFEVTVLSARGKVNKGWAGHVCERFLGIPSKSVLTTTSVASKHLRDAWGYIYNLVRKARDMGQHPEHFMRALNF